MPIYEYQCIFCKQKEEKIESSTAPITQNCTYCQAELGMQRQTSLASFVLTGGGWMAHGYSNKNNKVASNKSKKTTSDNNTTSNNKSATTTNTTVENK